MSYKFKDIINAYKKIGIKKGDNVLVKGDLRYLGNLNDKKYNYEITEAHFKALSQIIDLKKGTIIVSTASESLCNSSVPFDIFKTKSERGSFSEYVRNLRGSHRSFHPFNSHTSIGKFSKFICSNNSKNSFGADTPKDRMLKCNTKYVTIGLQPRLTCSFIHHAEMMIGVPYRYTKEFFHPIKTQNGTKKIFFYMYVCYKNLNLNRNLNVNLFKFLKKKKLNIRSIKLGEGKVYSYDCNKFVNLSCLYLRQNIYGWLTSPPKKRPYAK
jgi:aminoglycoside 3-N-acetyltransferase